MCRFKRVAAFVIAVTFIVSCIPVYSYGVSKPAKVSKLKVVQEQNSTSSVAKWKRLSGVSGYELQRKSGSGSWKTIKTVKSANTVKCVTGKQMAGCTYKYRVRAFKKSNGRKKYGKVSNIRTVRIVNPKPVFSSLKFKYQHIDDYNGESGYMITQSFRSDRKNADISMYLKGKYGPCTDRHIDEDDQGYAGVTYCAKQPVVSIKRGLSEEKRTTASSAVIKPGEVFTFRRFIPDNSDCNAYDFDGYLLYCVSVEEYFDGFDTDLSVQHWINMKYRNKLRSLYYDGDYDDGIV